MNEIKGKTMTGDIKSESKQIYGHMSEMTHEQLLDELMDFLCEMDEYTYDVAKHDAILAELAKFDSEPVISNEDESLTAFKKKYALLFDQDEK